MNLLARGRHALARRRWLYWAAVGAIALSGGLVAARAAAAVEDARRAWGTPRDVVVATADVEPGERLDDGTDVVARPAPAVPDSALSTLPPGAVARQHVAAGEVVVASDVAAPGGPRALVPDGWSAVAVAESVPTGVAVGDPVLAAAGGVVLATEGVVVGRAGEVVLVAVPADDAPHVAHAAATGELSLLLVP